LAGCWQQLPAAKASWSCNPKEQNSKTIFTRTQDQVFQGLIAVYDVMQWGTTGGYTMKMPLLSAASDDAYAGGSDASDQPKLGGL
jgi:hypothetical protein